MAEDLAKALMPPPPARAPKRPPAVLDEDEFAEKLGAIIERDYFPDIPKLQSQLEWLQAVNSGDPMRMRLAQVGRGRWTGRGGEARAVWRRKLLFFC